MLRITARMGAGTYLAVTSVYGTVYLSCLVVPKYVEDALWSVAVDNFAGATFALAAITGAGIAAATAKLK